MKRKIFIVLATMQCVLLVAQVRKELRYSVSYVAASIVYINAGRDGYLAVGDTVKILRSSVGIGTVVISAVSKKSSSSQIIWQSFPIIPGDSALIEKNIEIVSDKKILPNSAAIADTVSVRGSIPVVISEPKNEVNIVSGRIGIQYIGAMTEDNRMNLSQPSTLVRLSIQNLYNTGLIFSLYGRAYYDIANIYGKYGDHQRFNNRMYDFSLQSNNPESSYGFGIGRIASEYVGGMGIFDGGQFFFRMNNVTSGVLYGARVKDRTLGLDRDETKGSVFVNVRIGPDILHQYSGTLAYGRLLVKGRLDREYIYLQNFAMLGSAFSLYESSEIELNEIINNVKQRTIRLSNTFLSLNYYPANWISTNIGYDGSRAIYLFETMRSMSDTLLDKNLMQGYRAGTTIRLPYYISLSGNLSFRTKKGDARDARTISGSVRISDIAGTEIGAGVRFADIIGVYSNGSNMTVDVDKTLWYSLSLSFRYDYYKYVLLMSRQSYTTHTATVNTIYRLSRSIYSSISVEGIFENSAKSDRVFAEISVRF